MATRRYRVNFIASFDHTIEAESLGEARKRALAMSEMPMITMHSAERAVVAWNTIEPVED